MWKFVLAFALLLSFSFGLGWLIQQDPGYVVISYHNWSIETSLWFAIAALLVSALLIYWCYKILKHSFFLPSYIANWSLNRRQKAASLETAYGFCELFEAHWDKAEQKLLKATKYVPNPFINYVGAALAAQQKKNYAQRDIYLQQAQATLRGSETAVELLKAHFQMEGEQDILALHGVQNLLTKNPKHSAVLLLAQNLYKKMCDWPALLHLLPAVNKHTHLDESELKNLSCTTYAELLQQAVSKQDEALLEQAWLAVPKNWKTEPTILAIYAGHFIQDMPEAVLKSLEESLKKNWNEDLVRIYGLSITKNTAKQLKLAESWLKQHPRSATLLSCLGRLSARDQLWGKAQDYFNASLALEPQATIYWELAKIQEQLKRLDAAQESYKKGLALVAQEKY